MAALLVAGLLALAPLAGGQTSATARTVRGAYLARGVARCFWCHAPLDSGDPATPQPETLGSGDILDEKTPIIAPNITPDDETGLGRWHDGEIARAIREGIGRDGRRLRSEHPSHYYSVMTDEDAGAIATYLRSLPPIRRSLRRSAEQRDRGESVQPPVPPALASALQSVTDRGAYLVQLGECRGCHTTTTRDGRPERGMEFGGGRRFRIEKGAGIEFGPDPAFTPAAQRGLPGEEGLVASANITPDASGIAFYTRDVFIQTIRTGHVAGVRRLSAAMPWVFFRTMTDDDLGAIFSYLRTLPPVRHRVSNFDPPTYCPRCGRRHGLGELN
ncbi:MAG TPA: cytochrome c [Vicinamibacteria bacterium]|nr:cytochrome c [Vicinamibacteria bacterium]